MSKLTCAFEHRGETILFRHDIMVRTDGTHGTPYNLQYRIQQNAQDPGIVYTLSLERYDPEKDLVRYRVINVLKLNTV